MKMTIRCAIGNTLPENAEPTDMAETYGCTACEYIENNRLVRCSKFVYLAGKDPQSEDKFVDEGKCIDAWQPILQLETANTNRGQTEALESLRNETVTQQQEFIDVIKFAAATKHKQLT